MTFIWKKKQEHAKQFLLTLMFYIINTLSGNERLSIRYAYKRTKRVKYTANTSIPLYFLHLNNHSSSITLTSVTARNHLFSDYSCCNCLLSGFNGRQPALTRCWHISQVALRDNDASNLVIFNKLLWRAYSPYCHPSRLGDLSEQHD